MDILPWKTFHRMVDRCDGDRDVKSLPCAEQCRVRAFAPLTDRECVRDSEVCLSAQSSTRYHRGCRQEITRSTLADANASRDWRSHEACAQPLIVQARTRDIGDSVGIDLEHTPSALDSTTLDLCLSLCPWALFRRTTSAVQRHTVLQIFSRTLFETMPIQQAVAGSDYMSEQGHATNELNLFAY